MAQKEIQRAVYRSAKGKEIDLNKLVAKNELTIAVGNMKVNARGDKLGPGGQIIAKKEQIQASPQPVPNQSAKNIDGMDPEGNE